MRPEVSVMTADCHFPDLRHYRIEHQLPLTAMAGLAAALLWPQVPWAGTVCIVGFVLLALPMVAREIQNASRRRRWVWSFSQCIHATNLAALVREHPERYRLHVRNYRGFGMNAIPPAALVEDLKSGTLFPLVPVMKDVSGLAERLGLAVKYH